MNIDKRNRNELKSYFVKNAIPTEDNFAEFIDAAVNQKDDGLVKLPGDPLSIEASGDATSQKKAIYFYDSFTDAGPAWVLSLNPRGTISDPATARVGFNIGDGVGASRLFIDRTSGNVGLRTITPSASLQIAEGNTAGLSGGGFLLLGKEDSENLAFGTNEINARNNGQGSTLFLQKDGGIVVIPQEDWRAVSFQNGWNNYGGGYVGAGYFKDSMGIVHLRGLVKGGSLGTTIFTLPQGYRPADGSHLFAARTAGETTRINLSTDGQVHVPSYTRFSDWISLDGLTVRAA